MNNRVGNLKIVSAKQCYSVDVYLYHQWLNYDITFLLNLP